ncbi:MAG: hypothetical protein QNJ43_06760 [Breoghania sp.]|nr:hypothetical protein [Breoghania sp.]
MVVSRELARAAGAGVGFFDFAVVGVPVALIGIAIIVLWSPRALSGDAPADGSSDVRGCEPDDRPLVAEVILPKGSHLVGVPLEDCGLSVHAAIREGVQLFIAGGRKTLAVGDVLYAGLPSGRFASGLADGDFALPESASANDGEITRLVIMPESTLVESRVASIAGLEERGLVPVVVSPQSHRFVGRFADIRLSIGDVLLLSGERAAARDFAGESDCLVLAATSAVADPVPASAASRLVVPIFVASMVAAVWGGGGARRSRSVPSFSPMRSAVCSICEPHFPASTGRSSSCWPR